jgi:hypothetical protein
MVFSLKHRNYEGFDIKHLTHYYIRTRENNQYNSRPVRQNGRIQHLTLLNRNFKLSSGIYSEHIHYELPWFYYKCYIYFTNTKLTAECVKISQ